MTKILVATNRIIKKFLFRHNNGLKADLHHESLD